MFCRGECWCSDVYACVLTAWDRCTGPDHYVFVTGHSDTPKQTGKRRLALHLFVQGSSVLAVMIFSSNAKSRSRCVQDSLFLRTSGIFSFNKLVNVCVVVVVSSTSSLVIIATTQGTRSYTGHICGGSAFYRPGFRRPELFNTRPDNRPRGRLCISM